MVCLKFIQLFVHQILCGQLRKDLIHFFTQKIFRGKLGINSTLKLLEGFKRLICHFVSTVCLLAILYQRAHSLSQIDNISLGFAYFSVKRVLHSRDHSLYLLQNVVDPRLHLLKDTFFKLVLHLFELNFYSIFHSSLGCFSSSRGSGLLLLLPLRVVLNLLATRSLLLLLRASCCRSLRCIGSFENRLLGFYFEEHLSLCVEKLCHCLLYLRVHFLLAFGLELGEELGLKCFYRLLLHLLLLRLAIVERCGAVNRGRS